ncbi:MAG TPA: OmpA family protein [Pseudomonadales bacterium]
MKLYPYFNKLKTTVCIIFTLLLSVAVMAATDQALSNNVDYGSGVMETSTLNNNTEQHLPLDQTLTPWKQQIETISEEETFELKKVLEKTAKTKKLKDLVPPILFKSGKADIPEEYVDKLREILRSMEDRVNVRLHFIGHTDNVQLKRAAKEKYGSNLELSKERAGTTAEYFQAALGLPPEAISYEGFGDSKPVANNNTKAGQAQNRRVEVQVWYDEINEKLVDKKVEIDEKLKRTMVCRMETVCKIRYQEGFSRRAKLKNLVPPMRYDDSVSELPAQFLQQLNQALHNLRDKRNVQIRLIAYTDNMALTGRDARIYGDHVGLSKARARRIALALQDTFKLSNSAISSTGKGASNPIASNDSEKGRALNRRVEVEFWYDDQLEELPDEPQICPESSAAETVEREYNPPEGDIKPVYFEQGQPLIPGGYAQRLQRIMESISDKSNVRLRFIGYTSNERLSRRTAMVYGDDIGLSTARARRVMERIKKDLDLTDTQVEFEGRGFVQAADVVNTGFVEFDRSKVEVKIVYDELALLDDDEGLEIKRITREVTTQNPYALNLMRISVDGQPLHDPGKSLPDVQRCTDVALDKAHIQFRFDSLELKPRLNVTAWPNVIASLDNVDTDSVENQFNFHLYSNYPSYIDKAEVRLFGSEQSTRDTPLAVIPMDKDGDAKWQFSLKTYSAPRMALQYLLRVYDKAGHFDETKAQTVWVVDELETDISDNDIQQEMRLGYGENRLALNNIPINGGAVQVYGKNIPKKHSVWFAGHSVPVADSGEFASEMILPANQHTVEVSVLDPSGNGEVFLRDLELKKSDWFHVGIADLTLTKDNTNGPAALVTGDNAHYDNDLSIDGRLAFYSKGKFANDWTLTASADTREGPVDELFSNFLNKSPDGLFRRIDPDYYYPTYGDDSTVEENAPTAGKLYTKLEKDKNHALWGSFDIAYTDNNLAHVDRNLYGANINFESDTATSFGEKRFQVNSFGAEPGTVAGRDEFRGTNGSLYFIRHQDILTGSERVRVETRDAISGLVIGVKNLSYGLDYDIDYLQGRILLSKPLSAFGNNTLNVDSGNAGAQQTYLVVRYEYTPGFTELENIATGGRAHYWFGDLVKLGVTADQQESTGTESNLSAVDLTIRKNAGTWLKLEQSSSQGPGSATQLSNDGGFSFTEAALAPDIDIKAKGQRIDFSLRFEDVVDDMKGKLTFYNQQLDGGYATPGLIAQTDTTQTGATLTLPVGKAFTVKVKNDAKTQDQGLDTEAVELDVDYQMGTRWAIGTGLRKDNRTDNSPSVALTQKQGDRSDLALKLSYDTKQKWNAYGYVQETIKTTGNREDNARIGVGGGHRFNDRLKLDGELSSGDIGSRAKLASDYKMTDNTNLYTHYALENERTDNGVKAQTGNLASGFKTRYSDSADIYFEEKYTHGDVPTGLTHSFGFDLAATDRLNFGGNIDVGTLEDNNTAAEISRTALGASVGYKFDALTYAGAFEYRVDETQQADTTRSERTTWLLKNSLKYQLNPNWRLIGKLNHATSDSSQGEFYDGEFTEAVLGYAYRPIKHDTLNTLVKYTYFFNVPTTDQVTIENTAAEYIQKSHILSIDTIYDLTTRWSLGGKYAYRLGELSQSRTDPEFFSSDASLYVLRADWHFIHRWDALIEARLLDLPDAADQRSGFLLALYRHVGEHLKFGVGYNFTDFSDDLTDLDFDSQGLFIKALGKF